MEQAGKSHLSDADVVAYVDGSMTAERRARAAAHVAVCSACKTRIAEFREVGHLLRDRYPLIDDPAARARIVARIQEMATEHGMTDRESTNIARNDRLTWHPDYRGKTVAEVAAAIRADLEHDQRAYELVLESADERENDTLAAILTLDKKWGTFDMGWAEADTAALANRIAAFELERDRRQALVPFADLRDQLAPPPAPAPDRPWWAFWRR